METSVKLPRWLLVSLLIASILGVLGAVAWWWVTWPDRTAGRFLAEQVGGTVVSMKATRKSFSDWIARQAEISVTTRYGATIYTHIYEVEKDKIRCIETQIQNERSSEPRVGFALGVWSEVK